MRWLLIAVLTFSVSSCGKDKKKRRASAASSSEPVAGLTDSDEPRQVTLAWDGEETPGKVSLAILVTDDQDKETKVNLGSFDYNSPYTEGFVPTGCRKCVDRYSTCKKLKPNVLYVQGDEEKAQKVRLTGQLCARLGRECDKFCENAKILNVTFNDGVVAVHSYADCVGARKVTCYGEPDVLKTQRVAPPGSTLAKKKKKKLSKRKAGDHCYRKYCEYGGCNNPGYTRCMNYYGVKGYFDCGCG